MSRRKHNGEVVVLSNDDPIGNQVSEKKKPGPRQVMDPFTGQLRNETREERFIRLCDQRMTNAVKRLDSIRKLANRSQYDYTEEDVTVILTELQTAVNNIRTAFSGNRVAAEGFRLRR